jgi:hypothetical protein
VQREAGGDSAVGSGAAAPEPTPEEAAALVELVERLLSGAGQRERPILALTLQGETPARIAEQVGCSERKVYRVQEELRVYLERLRDGSEE